MADPKANDGSPMQITQRVERSFAMAAVQFFVRCFRKQLEDRNPKHEDGSVKLNPSKGKLKGCTSSQRTVCDIHIYDIIPPTKRTNPPTKHLYYFAGGSWQFPPSGQHYQICGQLAKDMSDTIVSIVSMPLAPNDPAPSSFPFCMKLYRALMAEAEETGERVILAGDSSGANVVLSLALEAVREDADRAQTDVKQMPHPVAIVVISPSTDLTRNNPDIQKIAPKDPLLTPDIIKETAKAWHGDWDPADRRVSPINSDISLLAKRGIKVHGITGGFDVLSPDGIIFRDKCADEGIKGDWVHWERQMHCFILTFPYGLWEAKQCYAWLLDILKKD